MTARTRSFHVGDLLSVTTGYLVSPRHFDGIYDVVDFVTGLPHMTSQLPGAVERIKPWLLEQHPWLDQVEMPENAFESEADFQAWMRPVVERFGEQHQVEAMPEGAYQRRDLIAELHEMRNPEKED